MEQIVINKNDELVMKLLHYFITEMGYSPIVLHGAKDEIWLEKLDGDYQIVRIVSNYIHNNDQLNFDLFRTRQIMKQIKKKTFSFNMNTLSLFVNLGDNVDINQYLHTDNIDCASIQTIHAWYSTDFPLRHAKNTSVMVLMCHHRIYATGYEWYKYYKIPFHLPD